MGIFIISSALPYPAYALRPVGLEESKSRGPLQRALGGLEEAQPVPWDFPEGNLEQDLKKWLKANGTIEWEDSRYGRVQLELRLERMGDQAYAIQVKPTKEWLAEWKKRYPGEADHLANNRGADYLEPGPGDLGQILLGRYQFQDGRRFILVDEVQAGRGYNEMGHTARRHLDRWRIETIRKAVQWARSRKHLVYGMTPGVIDYVYRKVHGKKLRAGLLKTNYERPFLEDPETWKPETEKFRIGLYFRPTPKNSRWYVCRYNDEIRGGLEENLEAAAKIIRDLNLIGNLATPATPSDTVVRTFIRLMNDAGGPRLLPELLNRLIAGRGYYPGPFTRGDVEGLPEEEAELLGSLLGDARRVLENVGRQLDLPPAAALRLLGWSQVEQLGKALYSARAGDRNLLLANASAETMSRWFYRELTQRVVPVAADPSVDRQALSAALANPFRLANDTGNQAMVAVMRRLVEQQALFDDPEVLRRNPSLVRNWISLLLAANLVDYSHESILNEIAKEKGNTDEERLGNYVLRQTATPFAWGRHNGRDMDRYVEHVLTAQPRAGRHEILEVVLGDNNAQLAVTLKAAEVRLSANPALRIKLVLKADNAVMNDASVADARALLAAHPDFYRTLLEYEKSGRFEILAGPASHGTPLDRLSPEVAGALLDADVAFVEGEANTWMVNGLRVRNLILAWRLKWPQGTRRVVGLNPSFLRDRPPAFMYLDGFSGRYYGNVLGRTGQTLTIEDAWARPLRLSFTVRRGEVVEGTLPTGEPFRFYMNRRGRVVTPEYRGEVTYRRSSLETPGAPFDYTRQKTRRFLPGKRAGDQGYERMIIPAGIYSYPTSVIERLVDRPDPPQVWRVEATHVMRELRRNADGSVEIEISYRDPETVAQLVQLGEPGLEERDLTPGANPLSVVQRSLDDLNNWPVTQINRWPTQMELLRQTIVPEILSREGKRHADVMSLPMATGEEPATVASTIYRSFDDTVPPDRRADCSFRVVGVEKDLRVYEEAKKRLAGVDPLHFALPVEEKEAQQIVEVLNAHRSELKDVMELVHRDAADPEILKRARQMDVILVNVLDEPDRAKRRAIFSELTLLTHCWILTTETDLVAVAKGRRVQEFSDVGEMIDGKEGEPVFVIEPVKLAAPPRWLGGWRGLRETAVRWIERMVRESNTEPPVVQILSRWILPRWEEPPEGWPQTIEGLDAVIGRIDEMSRQGQILLLPGSIQALRAVREKPFLTGPMRDRVDGILARLPQEDLDQAARLAGLEEMERAALKRGAAEAEELHQALAVAKEAMQGAGVVVIDVSMFRGYPAVEGLLKRLPAEGRFVLIGEGSISAQEITAANPNVKWAATIEEAVPVILSLPAADTVHLMGLAEFQRGMAAALRGAGVNVLALDPRLGFKALLEAIGVPKSVIDKVNWKTIESTLATLEAA